MPELILRLEQEGRILGEWTLVEGPLSMSLCNPRTGETVATFQASMPDEVREFTNPLMEPEGFDAPTEREPVRAEIDLGPPDTQTRDDHVDEVGLAGLSREGEPARIPGDDFTMPLPEPTDPSRNNQRRDLARIGTGYGNEKTTTVAQIDVASDIASSDLGPADLSADLEPDNGLQPHRTLEPLAASRLHDETTYIRAGVHHDSTGGHSLRTAGSGAHRRPGAFPAIGEERDPLLEVWFYKNDQWVRRGWLSAGQRASLRGGVIRCARGGALLVSPGTWFTVSAVLPNGKQVQVEPGSKPVRLPAGSAVTLWDGERGLHVRDVEAADDDTQDAAHERASYRGATRAIYSRGAVGEL